MTVMVSSAGLYPSNMGAAFPNLARHENPPEAVVEEVTATCIAELEAAGIKAERLPMLLRGEVPAKVIGTVGPWVFERRWYYWSAEGPGIPVEIAEKLHAAYGTEVRADGHCGCPSPREWFKGFGVGRYHIDTPKGLKALADTIKSIVTPAADPGEGEERHDG